MKVCYVDKMQKIMAVSTKISAKTEINGRSASKIAYNQP